MVYKLLPVFCFVSAAFWDFSAANLNATLSYSGSFAIRVNDKQWFSSAAPFLVANGLRYSLNNSWIWHGMVPDMDRVLMVKSQEAADGSDILGRYHGYRYVYFADDTRMDLSIRAYDTAVIFTQEFPYGLNNPGVPDNRQVLSGFPALQWDFVFQSYGPSGILTFVDDLTDPSNAIITKFDPLNGRRLPDGIMASGPLCLFNVSGNDAVVIAPLTNVMHVSPWHRRWETRFVTEGQSYWGIDRNLTSLPAGFKVEVILVYSPDGVGKALETWGKVHRLYNRPASRPSPPPSPLALTTLGYWSGQGSYYHGNTTVNNTFENILLEVEEAAHGNTTHVPLRFFELDEWWYESANGTPGAVVTWEANNQSLPSGLSVFEKELGLPLVAVLGLWSANTTYAEQNNGSYIFHIEGDYAVPVEYRFWADLFRNASESNITHVILNNMATQYLQINALWTQAGMASDWLKNISGAASQAGITLTLSQALPRMLLEAWQYPAVVQVRVSSEYKSRQSTTDQWTIGVRSLLPKALGLAPFKDAFWSREEEAGNPYGDDGVEPNPYLQAVVATLSTGAVLLGDSKDLLGSAQALRCCRSDGLILKPSISATATDTQIIDTANVNGSWHRVGQTWATMTSVDVIDNGTVASSYVMGIALAADMKGNVSVSPSAFLPGVYPPGAELMAWSWSEGRIRDWRSVSDRRPLRLLPSHCAVVKEPALPCLIYLSPPLQLSTGEIVHLVGEDKIVPLSPQRVRAIDVSQGVSLTVTGEPREAFTLYYYVNDLQRSVDVIIGPSGTDDVKLNVTLPPTTTTAAATTTAKPAHTTTSGSGPELRTASLVLWALCVLAALRN